VSAEEHILVVALHHIISDVWSLLGVLRHELNALYAAYKDDRPSPLPELEAQYADYAIWQREWLQGEILERQMAYWREQLRGAPAALALPTDRPRPAVSSYKGARLPLSLSKDLVASLEALGRREGVTLYMTLLGALQVLLSRSRMWRSGLTRIRTCRSRNWWRSCSPSEICRGMRCSR
jgi:hypothetical protein